LVARAQQQAPAPAQAPAQSPAPSPAPAPAAAAPPTATTKVADNVYIFRYVNHQAMFIVTPAGVIATDPISLRRPAKPYIDAIQRIGKRLFPAIPALAASRPAERTMPARTSLICRTSPQR